MAYTKLVKNFFEDGSWRESKWTEKQFIEFIESFLAMNATMVNIQDCDSTTLQTVV